MEWLKRQDVKEDNDECFFEEECSIDENLVRYKFPQYHEYRKIISKVNGQHVECTLLALQLCYTLSKLFSKKKYFHRVVNNSFSFIQSSNKYSLL